MTKSCKNYRRLRGRKRTLKRTQKRTRTLRGGQFQIDKSPVENDNGGDIANSPTLLMRTGGRKRTRTLRGGQSNDGQYNQVELDLINYLDQMYHNSFKY